MAICLAVIGRERQELSGRLMQMTRMEPFGNRQAAKLSGGMKQKLALMCTLLHKPRVLFPRRTDKRRGPGFAAGIFGRSCINW